MAKYSVGVDYGSLSARAVLVNLENGREEATAVFEYPHAVMDREVPGGARLGADWALQHPQDYLDALKKLIPEVLASAKVRADTVVGVGIDFTACTILPILADGTPLCFCEGFKNEPHAYVKLWKHHAAQPQANRLNEIAEARGERFLKRYGGKISSEWVVPKVMQIVEECPAVYEACDRIMEAADWIVMVLTGKETRNCCTAGYKSLWSKSEGFPSNEFFAALHPKLEHFVDEKLSREILPIGTLAGGICPAAAELTGLKAGTAVAVGNVDAHVAVPAVGITGPGKCLMIMGTSICDILMGEESKEVPGMCGVVEDGVLAGYFGFEAGQSCVGDHFAWFVKNCVPASYERAAKERGLGIHEYLTELAASLKIGESGLVALDWWNGNRSVLVDVDLSGLMLGMTLQTRPEEMYRALIEATAFGSRMIIDTFAENGVPVDELYACGGIAEKNALMMQIYADVTNREIRIGGSPQTPALGSAIFGAVAAGSEAGGFATVKDAAAVMATVKDVVYRPIPGNVARYDAIYREYRILHDLFGRGGNDVLKRLKKMKAEA